MNADIYTRESSPRRPDDRAPVVSRDDSGRARQRFLNLLLVKARVYPEPTTRNRAHRARIARERFQSPGAVVAGWLGARAKEAAPGQLSEAELCARSRLKSAKRRRGVRPPSSSAAELAAAPASCALARARNCA